MSPGEAYYWLKCRDKDDAANCIGCGNLVHKDFGIQNIDDEWACPPCASLMGRQDFA